MKISKRHQALVKNEFTEWLRKFCDQAIDYRETLLQVMDSHSTKLKLDDAFFKDLAKSAVIREMVKFTDCENAVDSVQKFLDELDSDDDNIETADLI